MAKAILIAAFVLLTALSPAAALDTRSIDIVGTDIDNPWAVAPIGPVPKQDGQS